MEIQNFTLPEIIVLGAGASLVISLTGQAVAELIIQGTKKIYESGPVQRRLNEYQANYLKDNPLIIEQPTEPHIIDPNKPWYE